MARDCLESPGGGDARTRQYRNLHGMNGLKNLLASILSLAGVVAFIIADLILWHVTAPMIIGNIVGAYITSRFAQRMHQSQWFRVGIIFAGLTILALFSALEV